MSTLQEHLKQMPHVKIPYDFEHPILSGVITGFLIATPILWILAIK